MARARASKAARTAIPAIKPMGGEEEDASTVEVELAGVLVVLDVVGEAAMLGVVERREEVDVVGLVMGRGDGDSDKPGTEEEVEVEMKAVDGGAVTVFSAVLAGTPVNSMPEIVSVP